MIALQKAFNTFKLFIPSINILILLAQIFKLKADSAISYTDHL